jgi:hypothetical protein
MISPGCSARTGLTNNLLVSTILPGTNVNKVEHCLCSSEASHKFVKVFECFDRTQSHKLIREATDVSIHSTDNTGG